MRPTLRPRPAALLVATALALLAGEARGWGRVGHRASARLAEGLLTPATKAAIRGLLDPGESLADASTWPDEHRRDLPESARWHYVNVPITEPRYDRKFCGQGGCVVSKVADFRAVLGNPAASRDERRKALRFVVHLVQDLHQPVHVGDRKDRGGNDLQVQFFGKGSNLHRVWDSGLIEHAYPDEGRAFAKLSGEFTPDFRRDVPAGPVESWADESLALARDAYDDPATGRPLRPGAKLGDAYQSRHLIVAERRLLEASVRLAGVLNATLDPAGAAPQAPGPGSSSECMLSVAPNKSPSASASIVSPSGFRFGL